MTRRGVRIALGLALLGLAVLVRYAVRDIHLDIDLLVESLNQTPGVVMEDIRFEREISGDLWNVRVPYLDREGERISVRSLDISRQLHEGGEWYFFGTEGVYLYEQQSALVHGVRGTFTTEGRVWNLESPEVGWSSGSHEFLFPKGLTFYDEEFMVQAGEASMDEAGVVLLDKGGTIQWTKPLELE